MREVGIRVLRVVSCVWLAGWCSTAAVSPQGSPSSDPMEGTIHPLLRWSNPELIAATQKNPKYPRSAKKAGVGAELILLVQIDATGSVTSVGVTRSRAVDRESCQPVGKPGEVEGAGLTPKNREAFATAAADAILHWKYRPAMRNGRSVGALIIQIVRFCPEDGVTTLQ